MELALSTDGLISTLRVVGPVTFRDTPMIAEYLRVARENGAVRGIVDFSQCPDLPTTIVAVLTRELIWFTDAGGALSLSGLTNQNPFLVAAVSDGKFKSYRSADEAAAREREQASKAPEHAAAKG